MQRLLLAVDDSPAALAAARTAVRLAAGLSARLRVVTVRTERVVAEGMVRHVLELAAADGVEAEAASLQGQVARAILDDAAAWRPDLLVLGLSSHAGLGTPYIGSLTRHLLEFADLPVLVVPAAPPAGRPPVAPTSGRVTECRDDSVQPSGELRYPSRETEKTEP